MMIAILKGVCHFFEEYSVALKSTILFFNMIENLISKQHGKSGISTHIHTVHCIVYKKKAIIFSPYYYNKPVLFLPHQLFCSTNE